MNPSLRRNAYENAVKKEPIDSTVTARSKPEPKTPVISYDYEAAISQPDIPIYSKIDNNTQNTSWSEPSDKLSAPPKKRNLYVRGRACVTTKQRGTAFKSKVQAKKVTKTHPSNCDVAVIEKESIPSLEINCNIENYKEENNDRVTPNRQTPFKQNLMHSQDVQKTSAITKNGRNLTSKAAGVFEDNFNKMCIPQNKISKIPRIKPPITPNSFLPIQGESRVYQTAKLSARNEFKCSRDIKSPADNEKKKLIFDSKEEILNALDYQELKIKNILPIVHENSNPWCPEKSSDMDADEEFEGDLLTPTRELPIVAGVIDDPRSATLLKSLALKCECRSCNNHEYASTVRTHQHTETESWSSPEIESARKWKSTRHRKVTDVSSSSEDLDSLSDYNAINYNNGKTNRKKNETNLTSYITKQSSKINHTRMKTYRTNNLSFFNVFFDIVFWPFVFLRAKQ